MDIVLSLNQVVVAGSELTRGGTAVRGGGRVTSETGKKAISDMVDSYGKILKTGKGVDEKNKNTRPKNPEEEAKAKAKKDLQKDIKQFLACISIGCHLTFGFPPNPQLYFGLRPSSNRPALRPRLKDKSNKARELAMDLQTLGIPHQEAPSIQTLQFINVEMKTKCISLGDAGTTSRRPLLPPPNFPEVPLTCLQNVLRGGLNATSLQVGGLMLPHW